MSAALMPSSTTGSQLGRVAAIRQLNDQLRQTGRGGRVVVTAGVAALPESTRAEIFVAVCAFDGFDGDNDPHGEHDCAMLAVGVETILWKIDYYDLTLAAHSPDPADPEITARVLTVMLAEEY